MRRISSIVEQLLAYEDQMFHGVRLWNLARMLENIPPLQGLYLHRATETLVIFGGVSKELNDLYSSPNIVRVIKSRRMRWTGHVARMGEDRGVL